MKVIRKASLTPIPASDEFAAPLVFFAALEDNPASRILPES
jgi:hypothetical protein